MLYANEKKPERINSSNVLGAMSWHWLLYEAKRHEKDECRNRHVSDRVVH